MGVTTATAIVPSPRLKPNNHDANPPYAMNGNGDGAWLPRSSRNANGSRHAFSSAANPAPTSSHADYCPTPCPFLPRLLPARRATDWPSPLVSIALAVLAGLLLLMPP